MLETMSNLSRSKHIKEKNLATHFAILLIIQSYLKRVKVNLSIIFVLKNESHHHL